MYSHTAKYQCHSHNKDSSNPQMFIPGPEKFSSNLGRGWTWKTEGNSKPVVFQCNTFPTTVKQQPNRASQCLYGITINVPVTWAFPTIFKFEKNCLLTLTLYVLKEQNFTYFSKHNPSSVTLLSSVRIFYILLYPTLLHSTSWTTFAFVLSDGHIMLWVSSVL